MTILKDFMGVAACFVMRPRPYEQTFVPFPMAAPHVSDEISFEYIDDATADTDDRPLPIL